MILMPPPSSWRNYIKITNVGVGDGGLAGASDGLGKQQVQRTPLFLFLTKDFEKKPPSNDPQMHSDAFMNLAE